MTVNDKYSYYNTYYNRSKDDFNKLISKDKIIKNISRYYNFYISPGGSNGENNKRIVEVFWGQRVYDTETNESGNEDNLIERGATLKYSRLDNGNVLVALYPAKSKYLSPGEESIFIDFIKNPKILLKLSILKKHLQYLKSYMNITSLYGEKYLSSKIIVFYLRNFKNIIFDKKICSPKIFNVLFGLLKFVLTVGLSGFLLMLVSSIKENKNQLLLENIYNNQLKIINIFEIQNFNNETTNNLLLEMNQEIKKNE